MVLFLILLVPTTLYMASGSSVSKWKLSWSHVEAMTYKANTNQSTISIIHLTPVRDMMSLQPLLRAVLVRMTGGSSSSSPPTMDTNGCAKPSSLP